MNSKVKDTIHTIEGYTVDPNAYGLWTRKNGYPVKLADEGKEKESEVDE